MTRNTLPPTKDRLIHDVTYVGEEREPSLQEREFEMVACGGTIGDEFGWYYNRGIELSLADAERRIQETEEELALARSLFHIKKDNAYNQTQREKLDEWVRHNKSKAYELGLYVAELDNRLAPNEEGESVSIYTFFEMYIDKLTLGEMAFLFSILEDKRAAKEVSWNTYLDCGVALTWRLAQNTKQQAGWWEECDRLRKHKEINHNNRICASYEDRFYGEISFNMEDAIDQKRRAESLATAQNMDPEEAWYTLMEQAEYDDTHTEHDYHSYDDPEVY